MCKKNPVSEADLNVKSEKLKTLKKIDDLPHHLHCLLNHLNKKIRFDKMLTKQMMRQNSFLPRCLKV
jgi:hypothetical protein